MPVSYGILGPQPSPIEIRIWRLNDPQPIPPAAPPTQFTGTTFIGKFYPRGMRGFLENIRLYCIRTGVGTLDVSISPFPGVGPIFVATITPGATWNFYQANIRFMWNYDSFFAWISRCDADVSYAYDMANIDWRDGHQSTDLGVTWLNIINRIYLRVRLMTSAELLSIGGTINNIEIPQLQVIQTESTALNISPLDEDYLLIQGFGRAKFLCWTVSPDTNRDEIQPRIRIDGLDHMPFRLTFDFWYRDHIGRSTADLWFGSWNTTEEIYTLLWECDFPFRRTFEIGGFNEDIANVRGVYVWANVEVLT